MLMGDMGAEIVKVEAPGGDTTRTTGPGRNPGMACTFLTSNRNKRSIVLALKQASARDTLGRLIDGADVFVHSIRPPAVAPPGFSPGEVLTRKPSSEERRVGNRCVIYCRVRWSTAQYN